MVERAFAAEPASLRWTRRRHRRRSRSSLRPRRRRVGLRRRRRTERPPYWACCRPVPRPPCTGRAVLRQPTRRRCRTATGRQRAAVGVASPLGVPRPRRPRGDGPARGGAPSRSGRRSGRPGGGEGRRRRSSPGGRWWAEGSPRTLGGVVLLAMHGSEAGCPADPRGGPCIPLVYRTVVPGAVTLGVGVAVLGTGIGLVVAGRKRDARRATASVAPTWGGVRVSGRF